MGLQVSKSNTNGFDPVRLSMGSFERHSGALNRAGAPKLVKQTR